MSHIPYEYLAKSQWVHEQGPWKPPEQIILRDENGTPIGSTIMSTLTLTLYDVETNIIINGLNGVDIKNTRGCTLSSQGVFVLNLGVIDPYDTSTLLQTSRNPQVRCALVQYEWPLVPTKSDAIEIRFAVLNIHRRPT